MTIIYIINSRSHTSIYNASMKYFSLYIHSFFTPFYYIIHLFGIAMARLLPCSLSVPTTTT